MKREYGLAVLLLSLFRRRLAMIILLIVLPPTLIFVSSSLSIKAIETYSEKLLEYAGDTAITIDENADSSNCCLPIRYGLITVVSRKASLRIQIIAVGDMMKLDSLISVSLKVAESNCESVRVSVSPALLKELNATLGEFLEVCANGKCLTACITYSHSKKLENYLIVENFSEVMELNNGFLCVHDAKNVGRSITGSLIKELTEFSESYVLMVLSAYIPILYLADVKLLEELNKELKILLAQGMSASDLSLIFALSVSLITGLTALYSVTLSYLIVSAGITILRTLINPALPMPEIRAEHIILAVIATPLNFLISYLAFRLGGRHVIS